MGEPPTRVRLSLAQKIVLALLVLVPFTAASVYVAVQVQSLNSPNRDGAAIEYAKMQIVWSSGPTVASSHTLSMKRLEKALELYAPAHLREDIDVSGLIKQYGENRKIVLVILRGTYNSLPPDEGRIVTGDIAVLVDVQKNQGFYLMD